MSTFTRTNFCAPRIINSSLKHSIAFAFLFYCSTNFYIFAHFSFTPRISTKINTREDFTNEITPNTISNNSFFEHIKHTPMPYQLSQQQLLSLSLDISILLFLVFNICRLKYSAHLYRMGGEQKTRSNWIKFQVFSSSSVHHEKMIISNLIRGTME